jgi:hypothetical protein
MASTLSRESPAEKRAPNDTENTSSETPQEVIVCRHDRLSSIPRRLQSLDKGLITSMI